ADGGFCRGIDAGHVPWRRQRSVAGQGNKGVAAPAARAVATKEDAEAFADPCAHFQGRGGTGSLEAGHYRPLPARQNLSDLPVVGRSWAEVASGRPSGSGGVLYSYARVDESQFQLLSCDQHRLPQQLRQGEQPQRQLAHDPRRLLVDGLLRHDRRTDQRDLFAGARLAPRPAVIPGPGLSVPLDAGEPGAASNSSAVGLLEDAQDRQRSLRGDASRTQGGRVRSPLRIRRATSPEFAESSRVQSHPKMPPLCLEPETRGGGAEETPRRRGRVRAIAKRRRASRPNLQRVGRGNEGGFPRTVSGQGDAGASAAICILPAATAADPLDR